MGQKASSEVAGSSQPLYPSLPPEEQLPEAQGIPEVGKLSAEQGERRRGNQRLGWFRGGGSSILPHPGHSESRPR